MPSIDYQTGLIAGLMSKGVVDGVTGEIEITENGEYDVTAYETATVNVAGGGGEIGSKDIIGNILVDISATAEEYVPHIHTEIEVTDTQSVGTVTYSAGTFSVEKSNSDMAIVATFKDGNYTGVTFISFVSAEATQIKNTGADLFGYSGTITYNGQTAYWTCTKWYDACTMTHDCYVGGQHSDYTWVGEQNIKDALDYYFGI